MPDSQTEDALLVMPPLFSAIGEAMSNWAQIERWLCFWFSAATKIEKPLAEAIFFSARSFSARSDMFDAALTYSVLSDEVNSFMGEASTKAGYYNSFRNQMAHGIPAILVGPTGRRAVLRSGTSDPNSRSIKADITIADIRTAARNFALFYSILSSTYLEHGPLSAPDGHKESLSEYRERLALLPNPPTNETPSQKQLGRQRQRRSSRA